ncbi:hypothetical protein ACIRP7_17940 [Streptomyces sp. NPDC102270]|uniref:hypothetical protein n=1 Tax=Streptomyces sp. NPDC102270 TaxID=3366150 RepID=UPI003828B9A9
MQEARATYAHAYRVKHLGEQADAWYQASRLTEYLAAVRDHATSLPPGQEQTEVEAWLVFADAHLHHLTESVSAPKHKRRKSGNTAADRRLPKPAIRRMPVAPPPLT